MNITIETTVNASIEKVWNAWNSPAEITKWNFASNDWQCPEAAIDLRVGKRFNYRMEAKDGSMGFDFEETFTAIKSNERIDYLLDDDRQVTIEFEKIEDGVRIRETFEAEDELIGEQQRQGWQTILDNFKQHVESHND